MNRTISSGLTSFQCSFNPVDIESPSDSFEEPTFSAAIFRDMDVDEESRPNLLPTVCRANPITDKSSCEDDWEMEGRVISPYPYSPTTKELDELQQLRSIEYDWKPSFREQLIPSIPDYQDKHDEAVYLSFYFEAIPSRDQGVDGDEVSFISHDAESLGDDEFCLDAIDADPESFWQTGAQGGTDERTMSPAQISLGSHYDTAATNDLSPASTQPQA
jgi:hypothetical protein